MEKTICPTCLYEIEIDETGLSLCNKCGQFVKPVDEQGGVIATSTEVIATIEKLHKS